jgi:hypothetical protein
MRRAQPRVSEVRSVRARPVIWTFQSVARSGQNSLAQGSPGVHPGLVENKRFALKELETRTRSDSKVPSPIIAVSRGPFSISNPEDRVFFIEGTLVFECQHGLASLRGNR